VWIILSAVVASQINIQSFLFMAVFVIVLINIAMAVINNKNKGTNVIAAAIGMRLLIFIISILIAYHQLSLHQDHNANNKKIKMTVDIEVVSIPKKKNKISRFIASRVYQDGSRSSELLYVSWYNMPKHIAVGDVYHATLNITPIVSNASKYEAEGADDNSGWTSWCRQHGIVATARVLKKYNISLVNHQRDHWLLQIRQLISNYIARVIPDRDISALVSAITVGVRSDISVDQWQVLQQTGVSHLLAVSGLHIAILALAVYRVVFYLWGRSFKAIHLCPSPIVAYFVSVLCALLYSLLSGFALPVQRAWLMLVIVSFTRTTKINISLLARLYVAFVVVLLFSPGTWYQASFWLSFTAVACIAYALWSQDESWSGWRKWLHLQYVLTIGLIPISLFFFGRLSLVGCLVNIIAIPWFSFFVLPVSLVALLVSVMSVSLGALLLKLSALLLWPLWYGLQYLSAQHGVVWWHQINGFELMCLILAVGAWLLPGSLKVRFFAIVYVLPVFLH